jgi:uncharacterized membrane protein
MPAKRRTPKILTLEIIGFLAIIALTWVNELLGLPSLLFGGGHRVNWPESLLETILIAIVAIPVILMTQRLIVHMHYLEEFVRVCGWCKKLNVRGEWVPVEEFFELKFETPMSHGICPACLAAQRRQVA